MVESAPRRRRPLARRDRSTDRLLRPDGRQGPSEPRNRAPAGWTRPEPVHLCAECGGSTNGAALPAPPTFDAIDLELAELVAEHRHDPAPVEREFVPTLPDAAHDVGSEVPAAELRTRAGEGLQVLRALMDEHERDGRGRLYDLVMEELEPGDARLVAFAAAVVAHEQRGLGAPRVNGLLTNAQESTVTDRHCHSVPEQETAP